MKTYFFSWMGEISGLLTVPTEKVRGSQMPLCVILRESRVTALCFMANDQIVTRFCNKVASWLIALLTQHKYLAHLKISFTTLTGPRTVSWTCGHSVPCTILQK